MSYSTAVEPALHLELSIDQRRALESAAARLHDEFAGHFDIAIIEGLLYSCYDQFADGATVHDFLALLSERFARQRLLASAQTRGITHLQVAEVTSLEPPSGVRRRRRSLVEWFGSRWRVDPRCQRRNIASTF